MGLDNGIFLSYKNRKGRNENCGIDDTKEILEELLNNEDYLHSYVPYFDNLSNDICYWRKCWGLRNTFMRYLEGKYNPDEYEYYLDEEDINQIINILLDAIQNPDDWESPVWSWGEYLNNNVENLGNLLRLRHDIQQGFINLDFVNVIWYDSY